MTASSKAGRAGQAGVTLIELMVVVAIVGILMTVASVAIQSEPTVQDVGYRIANLVQEASRKAISSSPVPAEDIAVAGQDPIRIEITTDGGTGFQDMTIWRWDSVNDVWDPLTTRFISDRGIEVYGYTTGTSALDPGGPPPATVLGAGVVNFTCTVQGTCQAITLYLHDRDNPNVKARVVVMKLNGAAYVFSEW